MARTKDFDEDEVLNKAIGVFWLKGYTATSMQDLVDGLGISRSSLYDTFGDKHSLFIKALGAYQKNASGMMFSVISDVTSAKAAIRQLLDNIVDGLLNDNEQKGCFMVNAEVEVAPHDKDVNRMICANDKQVEHAFYAAIKKGQKTGEISIKQDARALARFIANAVKGLQVTARSTSDRTVFEDIVRLTMLALENAGE